MLLIGVIGKKKMGDEYDNMINAGKKTTVLMFMGAAIGAHIGNGFVVGGSAGGAHPCVYDRLRQINARSAFLLFPFRPR